MEVNCGFGDEILREGVVVVRFKDFLDVFELLVDGCN